MAKIYETQEDIKREALSNEVRDEQNVKSLAVGQGLVSAALSLTNADLAGVRKELHDVHAERFGKELHDVHAERFGKELKGGKGTIDKVFAYIFGALAGVAAVRWFSTNDKQKKAQAEMAALGPQQIVVPEGSSVIPAAAAGTAQYRMAGHADRLAAAREAEAAQPPFVKS